VEYKYCPQCGEEFQHWAETCPDCDCALGHERPEPGAAAAELPPASELTAVFVGEPWRVREPVDSLAAAGIASRVDAYPPGDTTDEGQAIGSFGAGTRVGVYVRGEDVEAVSNLDEDWVRAMLATETALDNCPACDAPLADDATGCASCGLEFPEIDMCERCGSAVAVEAPRCGTCGADLGG
jgi:hypothetical protein